MLIDFHTHFFPENIAEKTVRELGKNADVHPYGDGTIYALKRSMKKYGVDLSVNMPIATKPEQVKSINRKVIQWNREYADDSPVVSFGTMHPLFNTIGNIKEELEFLSLNGVKGIKLHPHYQNFYPDDSFMLEIYESARDFGLIITFHAGYDRAFPNDDRANPKRLAEVAKIKDIKLILAHMGGYQMWDDVYKYLVGLNIYFDTGFSAELDNILFKDIILAHGAYKILFGTDFPWESPENMINKIKSLDLGNMNEELIFYKNAKWILDI